jgi:hypothetical protein
MLCGMARGSSEDSGFRIPTHVHVCVTADGSVLLDLKRDRYFGVGRPETELLATFLREWPKPAWSGESLETSRRPDVKDRALRVCESLMNEGLLLRDVEVAPRCNSGNGDPAARDSIAIRRDMKGEWISIGDELEVEGKTRLRDVSYFAWSYLWVRLSLKFRPFAATVESMRNLKVQRTNNLDAWHGNQVAALVDVFRRLRPFVFAAEGRCLLHALTLVKFLSHYGFHPEWMIGVSTQPWGAHSWVQWGNFLLDTNPEKVCGYTPIMMV